MNAVLGAGLRLVRRPDNNRDVYGYGRSVELMRPPAPWTRRFWRLPPPPQDLALPTQEQFGRDEVHTAG